MTTLATNLNRILTHLRILEAALHARGSLTAEVGGVRVPVVVTRMTDNSVTLAIMSRSDQPADVVDFFIEDDFVYRYTVGAPLTAGDSLHVGILVPSPQSV